MTRSADAFLVFAAIFVFGGGAIVFLRDLSGWLDRKKG